MILYKHIHRNEVIYEEDAEAFALDQLGITVKPKNEDGTYTKEQIEFLGEFTEWYFSDNWIKEEDKEVY